MNKTILAIVYFVFSAFILYFGIANMINGQGKLWVNILIVVIGIYFLYRCIATAIYAHREKIDEGNDPANS
ncbi:MAG: hypothetical protein LKK16_00605 [Bacteroidales bacterium]|jgi:4-hydroxybenzoate polyprenyltransferase|nr:hypothetical protein [Bacteroidales bacterium]MDY2935696.1 hypothetical protein [Candidatus Cryptobacteroides sp.]MCH3940584.1 hypothetical protein [Bacteroidales bacterium]MCI2134813.1 hypothetical protein [Bacteroidales bacterium]MCI5720573.1 hypothetical protein [Bacteroidales bacterium]